MQAYALNGIPVLAQPEAIEGQGPVVIVIHGMSTTPEQLVEGWPPVSDGLGRVYWRLPVLREGRDAVRARREDDLFRALFWPVVAEGRAELRRLVGQFAGRPVGLFGFSIGGFLSLLGAADDRRVGAAVAVGGVADLEYLLTYAPDYPDWQAPDVVACRREASLSQAPERLLAVPTLILHGEADDVAQWRWMEPVARRLAEADADRHPVRTFPHIRHRLVPEAGEAGEAREEAAELATLRTLAADFLRVHLGRSAAAREGPVGPA